jgi:hypothetical protein
MSRDADASALAVVTQTMILADNLVAFDVTEAQGNSSVVADISRGRDGAIRKPIDHYPFVEKACGIRFGRYFAGEGDRIPERCERSPVGLRKRASARKNGSARRAGSLHIRSRNEGCGVAMNHYERRHSPESINR